MTTVNGTHQLEDWGLKAVVEEWLRHRPVPLWTKEGIMSTQGLEVKRITKLNGNRPTKAFCDVAIGNAYLIKGLRIVEGKNGLFVSFPREQGKDGKWYETVAPLSPSARQQLSETVLAAYNADEARAAD